MPADLLRGVKTILVIDWPSRDVPESLARAGFQVVVKGGPKPEDHFPWEMKDGEIASRRTGHAPEQADLVYGYRPLPELPQIISLAKQLQARIIWTQSGLVAPGFKNLKGCWVPDEELRSARALVEGVGLRYVTQPYIGDAALEAVIANSL